MFKDFSVQSKIRGAYTVRFIEDLRKELSASTENNKVVFIIDEKIVKLFKNDLDEVLEKRRYVAITCDEKHKNMNYSQEVIRSLLQLNVRKDDSLIAIGGGITQDLVAFIATILFRGVDWKFYPTTLLAQCDSCIGSKSSINLDPYKNLLGSFNPPSEILIYSGFLSTLSESEIRSGIGEMLHYFLTEGIDIANEVSLRFEELLNDRSLLPYFINNSLRIKKKIIEIDEFDTGIRHIFNYGHTFGHAIETITNYGITHGQAISIGMDIANYISFSKGIMLPAKFDEMHQILVKNFSSFRITEENIDMYCTALSKDKKNKGNKLGCILSRGAGDVEKIFLDIDYDFKKILLQYSSLYLN